MKGVFQPMKCQKCGTLVEASDKFCSECGVLLKQSQPIQEETLIKVANAVAHRLNNALSIILTNSQIVAAQITGKLGSTENEIKGYLQDIAGTAANSGGVIHQFQKFLNSFSEGYSQEQDSAYVDQIADSLQIPSWPRPQIVDMDLQGEKASTDPSRVGNISVIIIDDEEMIRHALSYALTLGGHHVITASEGQEALNLFQSESYDIAFVDLKMPGMDGWELADAIKQIAPDTMVVLMTGWSVQLDDADLRESHVDAVIAKPFELSQVNTLISSTLGSDDA
jgi:CheY-like chemotaxis protein